MRQSLINFVCKCVCMLYVRRDQNYVQHSFPVEVIAFNLLFLFNRIERTLKRITFENFFGVTIQMQENEISISVNKMHH